MFEYENNVNICCGGFCGLADFSAVITPLTAVIGQENGHQSY